MKQKLLLPLLVLVAGIISFAAFPVDKAKKESVEQVQSAKATSLTQVQIQANTGMDISSEETLTTPAILDDGKSQLVALLLVIFVGALGIHRFYLGYTGIGIIQLLTGGGCGIWALIDLIMIITGDLKPKDGDYTTKL